MFGLGDIAVSLVFLLTILSSILCIVYGIFMWKKPEEISELEKKEEEMWEKEEKKIEEEIL